MTKRKIPRKKMGAPKKEIDIEIFEGLCELQCTLEEIGAFFRVNRDTVNRWCKDTYDGRTYSEVFREKRQGGFISLRRSQWKMATKSIAMNIFLSKNYLGLSDNPNEQVGDIRENMDKLIEAIKLTDNK